MALDIVGKKPLPRHKKGLMRKKEKKTHQTFNNLASPSRVELLLPG